MNESNSEQASAVGGQRVQQNGVIQNEFQGEYMPEENPIQILAIVNTLLRRRWMIAGWTFALVVAVGLYSFFIATPTYSASAVFLPLNPPSMSDRMSSVAGPGSMQSQEPDQNTTPEYYTALLSSQTFLTKLMGEKFNIQKLGTSVELIDYLSVQQNDLLDSFQIEGSDEQVRMQRGATKLEKMLKITSGKSKSITSAPLLTITVTTNEAQLSADIANALLKLFITYNQGARNMMAIDNRKFVELQLKESEEFLKSAESALVQFSSRNRKISTPELQTEKDRLVRTVKVQEEVFITLKKQLELAKIREQENQISIEVLEMAIAPIKNTSPLRAQNMTLAGVFGIFLFGALALVLERFKNINRQDKNTAEFMDNLAGITREMTFGVFGRK
jgi:uncharacterized protein involved in exopolysaccharide biosynthesis